MRECRRVILQTVAQRKELLERSTRIAMVGASNNHSRASYFVFSYLRTKTHFTVHPINPMVTEIDGITGYPDLAAYTTEQGPPDIVDVFRRPSELLSVTRDAIAVGAKAIWFQYGLIDEEAIALADTAGLAVVVDRCLKVETARANGGLASVGMNTGLISSRRSLHRFGP